MPVRGAAASSGETIENVPMAPGFGRRFSRYLNDRHGDGMAAVNPLIAPTRAALVKIPTC
jgi:hypothetical protein